MPVEELINEYRRETQLFKAAPGVQPRSPAAVLWEIAGREAARDASLTETFLRDPALESLAPDILATKHLWLGLIFLRQRRHAEAEVEFLRAVEAGRSVNRDARQAAAWAHFRLAEMDKESRPSRAEQNYRRAQELAQEAHLDYLEGLASAQFGFLLQDQRRQEAKKHLERARDRFSALAEASNFDQEPMPYRSTLLYTLGVVFYRLGETLPGQRAHQSWERVVALGDDRRANPHLAPAYQGRAQIRFKEGRLSEAEADALAALRIELGYPPALAILGDICVERARLKELEAKDAKGGKKAASEEEMKNLLERAEGYYGAAVAEDPSLIQAHLGWAEVSLERGEPKAAIEHIKNALVLKPGQPEATHMLAQVEMARRQVTAGPPATDPLGWWFQRRRGWFFIPALATAVLLVIFPLVLPVVADLFPGSPFSVLSLPKSSLQEKATTVQQGDSTVFPSIVTETTKVRSSNAAGEATLSETTKTTENNPAAKPQTTETTVTKETATVRSIPQENLIVAGMILLLLVAFPALGLYTTIKAELGPVKVALEGLRPEPAPTAPGEIERFAGPRVG